MSSLIQLLGRPRTEDDRKLTIAVPSGFATDLSSVPRAFYAELEPEQDHLLAAIIYDYANWSNSIDFMEARDVFVEIMTSFGAKRNRARLVASATVQEEKYKVWNRYRELQAEGEKRILKLLPEDPNARWVDWKKKRDVFQD